ncbi:hypothetical protein NH340_JMT08290 [Sarcoptes scabiei]|nr:hypothetical protein NH340_JMT08290 [Sarcoptes scabiei]
MPPSIHSVGARSVTSITTNRSRTLLGSRKTKLHWWEQRPILSNAFFIDLQKGSYLAAIFTLAAPGTKHSRNFGISFMFVYSGNQHIRRILMTVSVLLAISAFYLLFSSIILMNALRKEHELKFRHWLRAMAIFIVIRFLSIIFQSIVNDLFFTYHQFMLILWFLLMIIDVFIWLVVYSNYQELSDITRLEDMAKLKMSTMSSLNASRTFSHHSLDSTNPYGRYGGPGVVVPGSVTGNSSLQPSPQIYHHSLVHNQPMTIHESHQNILRGLNSNSNLASNKSNIVGNTRTGVPDTPRSHHSSQNSLHASYLQMYSNTLSQRNYETSIFLHCHRHHKLLYFEVLPYPIGQRLTITKR